MCGKKNTYTVILSVAVTLCVSLLICFILSYVYAKEQYGILSAVTEQLVAEYPADEQHIVEIIKNSRHGDASNVLAEYGFETIDFITPYAGVSVVTAVLFVIVFIILLIGINHLIKSSYKKRINELTKYLEQINSGDDVGILLKKEDSFSLLQDEIYKTVTEMKTAKDKAVNERKEYADSLANIAHQIKTPVTAISLTAQTENNENLKKQADRLSRLVDSLLYISKIDAGVLNLKQDTVDVYTMLELSVETVEHIIHRKNITVKLPNHSEVNFNGDLDWSVEAFSISLKTVLSILRKTARWNWNIRQIHYIPKSPLKTTDMGLARWISKIFLKDFIRVKIRQTGLVSAFLLQNQSLKCKTALSRLKMIRQGERNLT